MAAVVSQIACIVHIDQANTEKHCETVTVTVLKESFTGLQPDPYTEGVRGFASPLPHPLAGQII